MSIFRRLISKFSKSVEIEADQDQYLDFLVDYLEPMSIEDAKEQVFRRLSARSEVRLINRSTPISDLATRLGPETVALAKNWERVEIEGDESYLDFNFAAICGSDERFIQFGVGLDGKVIGSLPGDDRIYTFYDFDATPGADIHYAKYASIYHWILSEMYVAYTGGLDAFKLLGSQSPVDTPMRGESSAIWPPPPEPRP